MVMVIAAGAIVVGALLFFGGNTSTDQGQTTQTTSATETTKLGGDVFKMRVFGYADSPDKNEWWLVFNVTMTPREEWSDVLVAPQVFFAQLTDGRIVAGQGVRDSMKLQRGSDTVSVSGKDEFPTTKVQLGEPPSGLVLFLLPKDISIGKMFFHNGQVTADLPTPPT